MSKYSIKRIIFFISLYTWYIPNSFSSGTSGLVYSQNIPVGQQLPAKACAAKISSFTMEFKRKATETAVVPLKKPRNEITTYGGGQNGALTETVKFNLIHRSIGS